MSHYVMTELGLAVLARVFNGKGNLTTSLMIAHKHTTQSILALTMVPGLLKSQNFSSIFKNESIALGVIMKRKNQLEYSALVWAFKMIAFIALNVDSHYNTPIYIFIFFLPKNLFLCHRVAVLKFHLAPKLTFSAKIWPCSSHVTVRAKLNFINPKIHRVGK